MPKLQQRPFSITIFVPDMWAHDEAHHQAHDERDRMCHRGGQIKEARS